MTMTTTRSTPIRRANPVGSLRRNVMLAMAMLLALTIGAGRAIAAPPPSVNRAAADTGSWPRSGAIFLVISIIGGYAWYFGFFPRLLRKSNPSWPLDAWRQASYGAWITTCLAAYAFKTPLILKVVEPFRRGIPGPLRTYFMEMVLLPIMALLGLLVIWNYRRDVTNRVRPG